MRFAPWNPLRGKSTQCRIQRARLTHDLQADTAYEVTTRIRFVELVAENNRADWTGPTLEPLRKYSTHRCEPVEHQVLAHESAPIRETIRKSGRARIQEQSRRADPVGCQHDDWRRLLVQGTVGSVVHHAPRVAIRGECDLAYAAAGPQLHAKAQRPRPEGHVSA